jgi:hypothetical protein
LGWRFQDSPDTAARCRLRTSADAERKGLLRCPSCESVRADRFEDALLEDLEHELDRGQAELEHELARLARANMADDVDRFIRALDADAIQPFDF